MGARPLVPGAADVRVPVTRIYSYPSHTQIRIQRALIQRAKRATAPGWCCRRPFCGGSVTARAVQGQWSLPLIELPFTGVNLPFGQVRRFPVLGGIRPRGSCQMVKWCDFRVRPFSSLCLYSESLNGDCRPGPDIKDVKYSTSNASVFFDI